jgi:hypothetical protein
VNADGEHKGNNLEQDVDVLEGHVLIEEFANLRIVDCHFAVQEQSANSKSANPSIRKCFS